MAVGGRGLRLRQVVGIAAGYTGVVLLVLADLVLMLLLLLLLLLLSLLYLLELLGRLSELLYLETEKCNWINGSRTYVNENACVFRAAVGLQMILFIELVASRSYVYKFPLKRIQVR